MLAIGRRTWMSGVLALGLLAACNSGGGGGTAIGADDMVVGAADAPVTLIEYASTTCPHCADFHETVWDQLKENYIDTGQLRVVFREFPTPPEPIAVAGFQIARCGGASPEQYFARLSEMFRQPRAILSTDYSAGVREASVDIGAAAGLGRDQVLGCINDEAGAERIRRIVEGSRAFNVTGTPTLILNGTKLEDPSVLTYEGLTRAIDAELES